MTSVAHIYQSLGRFLKDLGLMEEVLVICSGVFFVDGTVVFCLRHALPLTGACDCFESFSFFRFLY